MTDSTVDDFFTKKHNRLANIASVANIVAWIALAVQVLFVGARFIQVQNSYEMQASFMGQNADFMEMLREKPIYTAGLIVDLAGIFVRGIIYWLVLKGISLGLFMIVETDLNYRGRLEEENNE